MAAILSWCIMMLLSNIPVIQSLQFVNCTALKRGYRNTLLDALDRADKRGLIYDCSYEQQALRFLQQRAKFKMNKKRWFKEDLAEAEYERRYDKGVFKFRMLVKEAFYHWNPLFMQVRKKRVGCNYYYRRERDEHKVACLFGSRRMK
ncbi:unnamed protein product [Cylicocyclus nassatus]|uniref:Uncharacterized protein n=1 Tax=Cylicocyclus nassatus TaxID=53992 RepID=A0AA36GEU5_CYLNA|nr:unnamed protein product [Cylicocyclus nassatus]